MREYLKIIQALNQYIYPTDGVCFDSSELFNAALSRGMLSQLHSIYHNIAPSNSKIKPEYHHKNLRACLDTDLSASEKLSEELTQLFLKYRINFGRKFILISKLSAEDIKSLKSINVNDFDDIDIIPEILIDNDSDDKQAESLKLVSKIGYGNNNVFLLFEGIEIYHLETPTEGMLSEEGKKFLNQMQLRKKIVTYGFHRVIIDLDNQILISLIDTNTLDKNEDPADKFYDILAILRSKLKIKNLLEKPNLKAFFPSINKLYKDKEVGIVKSASFHTSSGMSSKNSTNFLASDIREDPFLQGGIGAESVEPSITRIGMMWPDIQGKPELKLKGDMLMFNNPKNSLYWAEILFATLDNKQAEFFSKPLEFIEE